MTGDEFATLFPITTDQSVLPAAGGNSGPTGGANFSDAHVNALTDPNAPLALLGDENNGSQFGSQAQTDGGAPIVSELFANAGLNEANLTGGTAENVGLTTIMGSLGVNFGTAASSAVLSFNDGQGSLATLRSEGEVVNFVRVADAAGHFTQLIGFVGADPSIVANRVFIATLDATAESGGYTITLLRPVDHGGAGADTLSFALNVTAADQFGSAQTQITVNVQDDIVALSGDVAAQGVTEDGLAGANDFTAGAGSTGPVDLHINWGADNDLRGTSAGDAFGRTLSFLTSNGSEENSTLTAVTGSEQPVVNLALAITGENGGALSSSGVELQYVVTSRPDGGEVLTAYKGDGRGDDARVFLLTLDPTSAHGAYSFDLLGTLDHATGSDSIGLTFTVQAADADGDIVNTSFTVNVADDAPVARDVVADMAENDIHVITLVEGVDYSFGTDTHDASVVLSAPTFSDVPSGIVLGTPAITLDANGHITIAPGTAFDALSAGATAVMHIPYTITDGDGDAITQTISVTIHGTNDAPVVTSGEQSGGVADVAETINPAASAGDLSATGTIGFADVDLSDRPTAGFTLTSTVPSSGLVLSSAQEAALEGAFAIAPGGANANNGTVDWTYAIAESEVDFLAAGESVVLTYTVTVDDGHGGSVDQPVTITVTGANDTPVIEAGTASLTELYDHTLDFSAHSVSGSLNFTDVDLNDVGHTASVISVARSGETDGLPSGFFGNPLVLSYLHIDAVTKAAGSSSGQIDYTFSAPDTQFDYLAKGQTVTLTYTVRLNDGDGGITTQTVAVTVTGTNDRPLFLAGDVRVGYENADTTGSSVPETFNGLLVFGDADRDDVGHTASVTGFAATGTTAGLNAADVTGALHIDATTKAANANFGTVSWSFSAADKAFDYLADGETVTLAYQVMLDDGEGDSNSTDTTTIYVTIVGTNDRPVITTGDQTRGLIEYQHATGSGTMHTTGGAFDFTDVDLTDVHTTDASLTGAVWSGGGTIPAATQAALAHALTTSITNDSNGDGAGQIGWTFGLADQQVDFLAKGETLTLTYTVALQDDSQTGNDAALTKTVTITITGTNDIPVLTSATGAWTEWVDTTGSTGVHSVSGTIGFTDVDLNDVGHQVDVTNMSASGVTDGLSSAELFALRYFALQIDGTTKAAGSSSGSAAWTFRAIDGSFDYLAEGQTVTLTYTVRVKDFDGGQDTDTITITVHGTNDRPEFNFVNPGALGFGAEFVGQTGSTADQVVTGTLQFRDADRDDVGHTASAAFKEAYGVTSGLDPASVHDAVDITAVGKNADSTNGTVAWRFAADDATFDYLAAGEAVVLAYDVTVDDNEGLSNSTDTITIYVTILGTNDAPVIAGGPIDLTDSELTGVQGSTAVLAHGGTFVFDDADLSDTHTASAVLTGTNWNGGTTIPSDTQTAIEAALSAAVTTAATGAGSGEISWNFSLQDHFLDFLAADETLTLTYTVQVTDVHGGSASQFVTVTIHGTNDAPVIVSGASDAAGTVVEAGDLAGIGEAGLGGALHVAASLGADPGVAAALSGLDGHLPVPATPPAGVPVVVTQADIHGALVAIAGIAGDMGTAIAVVWQHMDGLYGTHGANDTNLNAAFLYLGLEYASYVKGGGSPLVDVVAKYIADGGDADTLPDRVQSLHDNLLGNLTEYALTQRYGAGTALHDQMHALVSGQDASLLTRTGQAVGGYENDPAGSTASDGHAFDLAHGYAMHVSGQLAANDVDHGDNAGLTWTIESAGTYGTMAIDATTGKWTYTLDDSRGATQALGMGDHATESFVATVTDTHGASATQTVTVTINGTNDAPVLTTAAGQAQATLFAGGGLAHVTTADVAWDHKFHFDVATGSTNRMDPTLDAQIGTLLSQHPTDMQTVLSGVEGLLGHSAGAADAIAAVWTYIDSHYTTYYDNALNAAGVRLAIAYAEYVKGGGEPLTGVIVKYTADTDGSGSPDRVQSMHDNILGNLDQASIQDRFLSGANPHADPALYAQLEAEITGAGLPLGRPIYSGNESGFQSDPAPSIAWDVANGLLPGGTHQAVSGQLTATDVDTNDVGHLTWSLDHAATYGTMTIDAGTGEWTYTLDNSLNETRALGAGEVVTESFVATVTDVHGGSASQFVTVTIHGTNDAPVIGAGTVVINGNFEADRSYQTVNAPEGSYSDGSPQGWTVSGPTYGGWFAPNNTSLPDAQGAHGNNVLWLNDGQTATQIVGTAAVGHYELSVDVGDRIDASLTGLPAYSISLYAGGTLVANHITTATAADGPAWTKITLGGNIDATLAGQPLSIRLENLEAPGASGDFSQQVQVNFDNVKLDFVSTRSLSTITEDDIGNGGQTVASILGNSVTDVDHGAVQGIAIIGDNAGNGTWQYQDAGGHWVDFGTYSTTAALLLTASDLVRFVPNGAYGTTASFDYVAWDQTSGTTYGTANVTMRGGSTAFSDATGHALIDVTSINDAPVLRQVTDVTGTEDMPVYLAQVQHSWSAFDPDASFAREEQVSLTLKVDPALGTLSASSSGLSGSFTFVSNGDGSLTITTTASPGDPRDAITLLNTLLRGDNFGPNNHNGITFTPAPNFNGDVTVSYILDDHGYSGVPGTSTSSGQFNIHIDAVNDAPVAVADSYATAANAVLIVDAAHGLVTNDTDAEHSVLASIVDHGPSHGLLSLNADGSFSYTPTAGFSGQDSFTYRANDGSLDSNIATVTIDVTAPPNAAPIVNGESIIANGFAERMDPNVPSRWVPHGDAGHYSIPTLALLWNDSDGDGDKLTITNVSGIGSLSADGQYVLVPYGTTGDINYTVSDGIHSVMGIASVAVQNGNLAGSGGNNILVDNSFGGMHFVGGGGNDILVNNGFTGSDTFGDAQYANDTSGTAGNDLMFGSDSPGAPDNVMYGGNGNDTIYGRAGNDVLWGESGNDTLIGGVGNDRLTGGAGADTFVFAESGTPNVDTILDYNAGEGDKLDLTALLHAVGVGTNASAATVDSHIQLANDGANVKLQVDVGGGSWSDVAVLQGYHTGGNDVLVQFENQAHHLTVAA
ncbi:MAG: VCBS domain-containing protein [Rhizobiales bacterium]|nr:VCBS domain-containing protein [Hyphomicrobiales bacterium]